MKKNKLKFYDRYNSLFKYKYTYFEEVWDIVFFIPKQENFKMHLNNIGRLLEVEFGGVFEITYWDEREREIDTNIPLDTFLGGKSFVLEEDFSQEEVERVGRFLKHKLTGESAIYTLFT